MTRFYYNQSGKDKSTESYSFNPSIVLHYAMSDNSYLRWKGNIYNASPSLGDLSDVEQAVDSFQIRRGNPNLKSYMCYHTELTYEWKKASFTPTYGEPMTIVPMPLWTRRFKKATK